MKFLKLRKEANLTQQQLADKLNLNVMTYNGYEKEKTEPNIKTLCKIADFYGVSLDYLCSHKTQCKVDLGYLDETTTQLIELIQQLNDLNKLKAIGYISGLVAGQ